MKSRNKTGERQWVKWMTLTWRAVRYARELFAAEGLETVGALNTPGRKNDVAVRGVDPGDPKTTKGNKLVRVEIALPLKLNDGRPVQASELGKVYFAITRKFEGLTLWPSLGLSCEAGRAELDEHVWLTVIMPVRMLDSVAKEVSEIASRFDQRDVFWLVSEVNRMSLAAARDVPGSLAAE